MSSIVGHALIGYAIGKNVKPASERSKILIGVLFVALSISPDLDYIPTWVFGIGMEPRYTHSIAACVVLAFIAALVKKYVFPDSLKNANLLLMVAAPASHVVLDFLVGVHKNPVLWPFSDMLLAFEHGILPSAGRLNVLNSYLWRNLAIELGLLVPLALLIAPAGRRLVVTKKAYASVLILALVFSGYVGFNLQR